MCRDTIVYEIREIGMRAIGFQADVTDAMTLNTAVQQIVDEWGRIDIATCNADGGSPRRHAHRSSRRTLSVSSSRAISPARSTPAGPAVAAPMKEQRSGKIVAVGNQAGHRIESNGG